MRIEDRRKNRIGSLGASLSVLALVGFLGGAAHAEDHPPLLKALMGISAEPAEEPPLSIAEGLARQGQARVTVLLRPSAAPKAGMRSHSAKQQRRSAQRKVADEVGESGCRVERHYEQLNGFSATVTAAGYQELLSNPNVAAVHLRREYRAHLAEGGALIGAPIAHALGGDGAGITVAVIDTGIDYTNNNLGGCFGPGCKVIGGANFVPGSDPNDPRDDNGHGTAVAGIIAADAGVADPERDPLNPVHGIAPKARLVALKALDFAGRGDSRDIVAALDWILDHPELGIDIVNMSLGDGQAYVDIDDPNGPCMSGLEAQAVASLKAMGISVVVSSGNDGLPFFLPMPACVPDVIPVGAVYDADIGPRAFFTAFGACFDPNTEAGQVACYSNVDERVAVMAPANNARTTSLGRDGIYSNGFGEEAFGGTSAAAPYTAGVAALALEFGPGLTPPELRVELEESGDPNDTVAWNGNSFPIVAAGNLSVLADGSDGDGDGIATAQDSCVSVFNPAQTDSDSDTIGDLCDNCPTVSNSDQADNDYDGMGDACDSCTDRDGDGRGDPLIPGTCSPDNCPSIWNPGQEDTDGDGHADACESCPDVADPNQEDGDGDGVGDACDTCPALPNRLQGDMDSDGVGDLCDNCPGTPNPDQVDSDGNGEGDACTCLEATPAPPGRLMTIDVELLDPNDLHAFEAATLNQHSMARRGKLAVQKGQSIHVGQSPALEDLGLEGSDPYIDDSGKFLTFASQQDYLGENPDGSWEVFVYRFRSGQWQPMDQITDNGGTDPNAPFCFSFAPVMTKAARHVVYVSNCDPTGENPLGKRGVFLYQSRTGATELIELTDVPAFPGNPIGGGTHGPSIDAKGKLLAYIGGDFNIRAYDLRRKTLRTWPKCFSCTFSTHVRVGPKGKRLIYYSGGTDLFLMTVDVRREEARRMCQPIVQEPFTFLEPTILFLASNHAWVSSRGVVTYPAVRFELDPNNPDDGFDLYATDLKLNGMTRQLTQLKPDRLLWMNLLSSKGTYGAVGLNTLPGDPPPFGPDGPTGSGLFQFRLR